MSYRSNDIIFDKIYNILNSKDNDILNELHTMLLGENIRSYSIDVQDDIITIQWYDQRNKANVCAVPLNGQIIEGVKYERQE